MCDVVSVSGLGHPLRLLQQRVGNTGGHRQRPSQICNRTSRTCFVHDMQHVGAMILLAGNAAL